MQTLQRDIQLLNLSSNQIGQLDEMEFYEKKFGNLQKLYLNANQLRHIHTSAFYKLTGLIELDLSDNLLTSFRWAPPDRDDGTKLAPVASTRQAANDSDEDEQATRRSGDKLTSSFKPRTTSTEVQTVARIKTRVKTKTFLQDLSQLRQLNLNSNRLKRIGPFTFSPLVQLRQLYLSK